jgi:methyltransferase family protein
MTESADTARWTIQRDHPVELPHGKPIPSSVRGFMWEGELIHLNKTAYELRELGVKGSVLEIGSYCGLSACALAQPGPLVCIDTFTDSWGPTENERYTRPEFDRNMEMMGLAKWDWIVHPQEHGPDGKLFPAYSIQSDKQPEIPNAIVEKGAMVQPLVLECDSKSALEWLRKTPRRFRLILVDGGHSYKEAYADIVGSIPLLSPGGIMVIDDRDVPDVHRAAMDSGLYLASPKNGKLLFACPVSDLKMPEVAPSSPEPSP